MILWDDPDADHPEQPQFWIKDHQGGGLTPVAWASPCGESLCWRVESAVLLQQVPQRTPWKTSKRLHRRLSLLSYSKAFQKPGLSRKGVSQCFLSGIGVIEEDQPRHQMLVFGGIHLGTEFIGAGPEHGLEGLGGRLLPPLRGLPMGQGLANRAPEPESSQAGLGHRDHRRHGGWGDPSVLRGAHRAAIRGEDIQQQVSQFSGVVAGTVLVTASGGVLLGVRQRRPTVWPGPAWS